VFTGSLIEIEYTLNALTRVTLIIHAQNKKGSTYCTRILFPNLKTITCINK